MRADGHSFISGEDSEFLEFLKQSLGETDLSLERLPISCTSKVYRLRIRGGRPIFCKRKVAERHAVDFLVGLPETPLLIPLARKDVLEFKGEYVFFYEWRDVKSVALVDMTDGQFAKFLGGCRELYGLMAGAKCARPPLDADGWMENVKAYCARYPLARLFFRSVLKMRPEGYRYAPGTDLVVTHGDFHTKNFGFTANGQLTFMDFDLMVRARPVEDLVHLLVNGMRHGAMLVDVRRRKRLLSRFAEMIRTLPYPLSDWRLALNRERLKSASGVIDGKGDSFKAAREFLRRDLPVRFLYGVLTQENCAKGVIR